MLIHLPSPLAPSSELAQSLDTQLRVLSIFPRGDAPYQVHVADLYEFVKQFGFADITLVGEGLGCVTAVLFAAWHADRVATLRLVDPRWTAEGDSLFARSLRDAPPDWTRLRP